MPGVADGLVIELFHLAVEGLAQGAQASGGGKRLELNSLDDNGLHRLHGGHPVPLTAADHLAIVEVFVDHALGRPVDRVAQQAARVLGQRPRCAPAMLMNPGASPHCGAMMPRAVSASLRTSRVVGTSSVRSK